MGSPDQLTFEAILYENGNIVFQYQQLNGVVNQMTVGIEDADGVDGLLYLFNAGGLSVSKAIRFTRPPAQYRVKLTPTELSGFTSNQVASLDLAVTNTGELGTDRYNLAVSGLKGWLERRVSQCRYRIHAHRQQSGWQGRYRL